VVELPESADIRPPRGRCAPLEAFKADSSV
jgi:hypothetical protein